MAMIVGTCKIRRTAVVANADNEIESEDLVSQARTSYDAFALLYRRHYDAIFKYCVHRLFDRHLAEDVTSQIFLKVVENFRNFHGTEQQFRYWLFRIATNAVNQQLRKTIRHERMLKRVREQAFNRITANRSSVESSQERLSALKTALLSLKPGYQTIITLRFFENLKPTEIAEVLNCGAGTIRSQLARALSKLRRKLTTDFTDEKNWGELK